MTDQRCGTKFRKKPVVIEAMHYGIQSQRHIEDWMGMPLAITIGECLVLMTLEGKRLVHIGDWIVKDEEGEFYPCKPDVFDHTYEPVSAPHEAGGTE